MKTLIEDIEIIKKRIAHLRKIAQKSGGEDFEALTNEVNLIKENILMINQKNQNQDSFIEENKATVLQLQNALSKLEEDLSFIQQESESLNAECNQVKVKVENCEAQINQQQDAIDSHAQSIQNNFEKIDSAQLVLSGVFYKVEDLQTTSTAQSEGIASLQQMATSQAEKISGVESELAETNQNVSALQSNLAEKQNAIDALVQGQAGLQQTVGEHTTSIQENYNKIDSAQIILSGVFYDVEELKEKTTEIENEISSLGGGGDILGSYKALSNGGNNVGTGYIEIKISSNKILRVVYGIVKANGVTFDKPFDEILWAVSVPCHLSQSLATHSSTILGLTTTTLSFVSSSLYCRYEVWGLINA